MTLDFPTLERPTKAIWGVFSFIIGSEPVTPLTNCADFIVIIFAIITHPNKKSQPRRAFLGHTQIMVLKNSIYPWKHFYELASFSYVGLVFLTWIEMVLRKMRLKSETLNRPEVNFESFKTINCVWSVFFTYLYNGAQAKNTFDFWHKMFSLLFLIW